MQKFEIIKSIIAHLELDNVDTDMIIPKQFLKTIKRTGLGKHLFDEMRYDLKGNEITEFILNKKEFKNTNILLSGKNFGCGSSREHAPWALLDFGIRVVIAPSYADIFYNNCFKNSILPIKLSQTEIDQILNFINKTPTAQAIIDLAKQKIILDDLEIEFAIDEFRKKCLIEGLDDISLTLKNEKQITKFEQQQKQQQPWLYQSATQ